MENYSDNFVFQITYTIKKFKKTIFAIIHITLFKILLIKNDKYISLDSNAIESISSIKHCK